MSEQLRTLSQSIVEIAKEVDGHVTNYANSIPNDDKTAIVAARLALDRLLKQSRDLDELLYKLHTEELR